jgi:hypothetical protein
MSSIGSVIDIKRYAEITFYHRTWCVQGEDNLAPA